jgi:hypothetical protein
MKKTLLSAALATVLQISNSLASENGDPRGFQSSFLSPVCLRLPSSGMYQRSPGWSVSPVPHVRSALPIDYHSGATPSEERGPLSEVSRVFNFSPMGKDATHSSTGDPESPWSVSKILRTPEGSSFTQSPATDSRYKKAARSLVAAAATAAPSAAEEPKTHGYDTRRKTIDFRALARGNG